MRLISEASSFHTAIFDALCSCLNLSAAEGIKLIHEAYAEPENVPRPPRNRNVIYWTVLQDPSPDSAASAWANETGGVDCHTPVVCSTLKYQLIIVCYGPVCEEYAWRIRQMLFLDGSGCPRQILRTAGIYPVPDPTQPSILHEEEGSLWRRRADLTVSLRVRDEVRARERGSVTTAPAVILHHYEL